jgi:acetyltransferase EpsM
LPIGNTARWYVGVNNPSQRRAIVERLKLEGAEPLVDRSAIVGWCGEACPGVVVAPNVTLLRDVKLGVHTHVNYNSGLTRCEIGDFVTIGPGVTICGDVTVGDGTFIGAGAVVVKDVADGATVKGVPAK